MQCGRNWRRFKQAAFDLRDIGCRPTGWINFDGTGQPNFFAREYFQVEAQHLSLVKTFVEEAEQSLGDSTLERAVKMKMENLKVPFAKVLKHEIVPLEDRTTFWS